MQFLPIPISGMSARHWKKHLSKELSRNGVVIFKIDQNMREIEHELLAFSALMGEKLGPSITAYPLEGTHAKNALPIHTEGVYCKSGIINVFALGCVRQADIGGQTRIYDGRAAARLINKLYPQYKDIMITYKSNSYQGQSATYPLVTHTPKYGDVVRYRSKVNSNEIHASPEFDVNKFYERVDLVLSKCVLVCHDWKPGDLMFVNNEMTLHDRLPYQGTRRMLRMRYGDQLNKGIVY